MVYNGPAGLWEQGDNHLVSVVLVLKLPLKLVMIRKWKQPRCVRVSK